MKNSKDNIALRHKSMLQVIQKSGDVSVADLAHQFRTTPATIRRDLEIMEQKGYIQRYFGGARYVLPPNADVSYRTPRGNPTPEKLKIAQMAAGLISDRDVVFLNSSSTALYILDYVQDKQLNVITNNARALYSKLSPGIDLFLTGGEIYGNKQSLVGIFAVETVQKVVANVCFLGTSGVSAAGGITSSILPEVPINQHMLLRCTGPKVVVADGSKIGVQQNFFSASLEDITHLITDASADPAELERIRACGVEVLIAEPEAMPS